MNYDIIALDLDGTLLTDDHQVTDLTRETIRRAHAEGAHVVLCTGRGPGSTLPVLDMLGLEGTVITHNGAATVKSEGQKLLHEFSFAPGKIREAFQYCRDHGVHFDVCTAFDMYLESVTPEQIEIYDKFYVKPIVIPDVTELDQIVKVTLSAFDPDLITKTEQEIGERGLLEGFNAIRSGDHFIDVMHAKATKGNALMHFADSLQIPYDRILAIGNYFNDLEMLEVAGLGIAMDNSPEPVKRAADAVTGSNNEDGVAEALLKYCFS